MVTRLSWILQHPTPYNIYLLNELNARLPVPSEATYRRPVLASHPWASLPERRFPWRVIDSPGARDRRLEETCRADAGALVIFGGWRDRTMLPALLRRVRSGLPFGFWTDTPKQHTGLARRILNTAFVQLARRAVTTLATGAPAIERYLTMGVPRDRARNFPFVVDPAHFSIALSSRASRSMTESVRFVLPARLIRRLKGQDVALEALARARADTPNLRLELVLAGTGPDEAVLRASAEKLGISDAVRLAGWVEYDDLPALLGSADAVVLP